MILAGDGMQSLDFLAMRDWNRYLWSTKVYATSPTDASSLEIPKSWSANHDDFRKEIVRTLRAFYAWDVKEYSYSEPDGALGLSLQTFLISDGHVDVISTVKDNSSIVFWEIKSIYGSLFPDPNSKTSSIPNFENLQLRSFLENELDKKFPRFKPKK
jgi:hypothetical protein